MPHQLPVTIRAPVAADRVAAVRDVLDEANEKGPFGAYFCFPDLENVHFVRLLLVPEGPGGAEGGMPAAVVYIAEVDAPQRRHLADLVRTCGDDLEKVFRHCEGYPAADAPARARLAWLRSHRVRSAAFYVNTVGRGSRQILQEAQLREAIEEFLDRRGPELAGAAPERIRAAVQEHVTGREDLAWARSGPPAPALWWRIRETAHLVVVPLLGLLLLPVLLIALPLWTVLLRWHEARDVPGTGCPARAHERELAGYEDFVAQNPFTAVGSVKPGPFRRITLTVILFLVDYAARHFFNRGDLAGVKTIHFARWLSIEGGRRVVFASNYDGSLESYMDDFIDKVAWGLNAVFSNGLGYPRTRWLVVGGAEDELAFKHYLRSHQLPTQVWYSAYDTLTTHTVGTNARIRAGLFGPLGPAQTEAWLALL
ncbi:hypothetical protein [Streptomyces sp. NPDC046197]|uniref:hypothetical protein n=1 Tax=Streptomyces sp. NPDC046197 TaxID=3154337 RepID=UPI0033F74FFF